MDTAPLKSFATASRTELIREVGARITAVLAQGSPERVEQPNAVAALERAISGAGGGDQGKKHVAEKVAYTWFNRLIALRFMDANGYTGIGVVSPTTDQVGQPEVLAAAKRGQLDAGVVKGANAATIAGLLNGTRQPRPGVDAQAEAYALLLADYCRFWHAAMPFMFEREGDYTELLIPANLLAEDSILSRSVTVLTQDVCRDVEVIGWLYQFYISERKDEVFAGFKKNKKAGADEIPAATQLFTPHWIVRYLVENSLGRLWMLNHPESRLVDQMDYYIAPVDEETDFLKISKPEELTVIDPACGSGHMLTYAFDLLYAIYEEEGYAPSEIPSLILANNLYGTEIDPRAGALAAFALTMKAAGMRKLFLKNPVEPNICVLEPISFSPDELAYLATRDGDRYAEEAFWNQFVEADTLGALTKPNEALVARLARHVDALTDAGDIFRAHAIEGARRALAQAEYLLRRYAVVVANPPYMGNGNMGRVLTESIKSEYPEYKQDLYACFVRRGLDLTLPSGFVAMITGDTWLSIKSFGGLRKNILNTTTMKSLVHIRDSGNLPSKFGANTAYVLGVAPTSNSQLRSVFVRTSLPGVEDKRKQFLTAISRRSKAKGWFVAAPAQFARIPSSPIAYWLSDPLARAFSERLLDVKCMSGGRLKTHNDARYVRYIWEVSHSSIGSRWRHLSHGGEFRRWYGNRFRVVRWDESARSEYASHGGLHNDRYWYRVGITASKITSSTNSFRIKDPDQEYSSLAPTVFVAGDDRERLIRILGVLNSTAAQQILWVLNPSMTLNVGDILRVPELERARVDSSSVEALIEYARADWNSSETSDSFDVNPLLDGGSRQVKLSESYSHARCQWGSVVDEVTKLEESLNRAFIDAYGLDEERVRAEVNPEAVTLSFNPSYRYREARKTPSEAEDALRADTVRDLISYAVGCAFGRYSLDVPGLILADQGATLLDYLGRVPNPTVTPDADNVIPIVDGDWFEDDLVGLCRLFLRAAFGDQHFEENLKFVTEALGVKTLRDYFMTRAGKSKFYEDHVQRYKKRPIYWLFSSPKGSFNALIYMHRYTPSTVSTVLTYLREYVTKLESALQQAERAGNAKEADRLRKILVELNEYEHDTLYPKASENVVIDLDDGVKANYPKFGRALKRITGLEASGD